MRVLLLVSAAILLARPVCAAPGPEDFAFGKELTLLGSEAIYELDLPEEVYRRISDGSMEGIAVFNGDGELVPFRLFPAEARVESSPEREVLPFFPLPALPVDETEFFSVLLQRGDIEEILALRRDIPSGSPPPAYLVDLTKLGRAVRMLDLSWSAGPDGVAGKVRIEQSEDLKHWRTLTEGEPVATLRFGEHLLERRTVEVNLRERGYLRLTFQGVAAPFRLEQVRAVFHPQRVDSPRQRLAIPCRKLGAYEFLCTLPGAFPVDRIQVRPPQPNTVAHVTFFSRSAQEDPWSPRREALIYSLTLDGTTATSPEVVVEGRGDRHWLLRIDEAGGGMGEGIPEVEIGWRAHRLRFVARGTPPFLLAYGRGQRELQPLQADGTLLRLSGEQFRLGRVRLGEETVLGGDGALRRKDPPPDWKTILLWASLVGSVCFLGWMACTLYRRMDRHGSGG